jgi:hypothetical protein
LPVSRASNNITENYKPAIDSQTQTLTPPDAVNVLRENVNVTKNKVKVLLQTSNKTA